MGGNAAEAHPCGFKWVTEAKAERGAKLMVVDPRFTRSAAVADHYSPIRVGRDIAFLSGVVNYLLTNDKIHKEYVRHYTNAAYIVKEAYPPAQARLRRPAIVRPAASRAQAADADRRDGRYARSHRADHRTRRSQNRSNGPRHLDRCPAQSGGPPCCAPACRPHRRRARCVPRVGRWRGSGGTRPRHSGRGGVQNSAASLPTLVKAPWLTLARRSLTWRGAICRAASSVRSGTIAGHRRCIATG